MAPPISSNVNLDLEALSGICGSISIACWVVVFSPQIIENFRRQSAEGLSFAFIVIWLAGDIFNILGSILQRVLPTMIILAVYYTLADLVLIAQVLWYRGFSFKSEPATPAIGTVNGHHVRDTERQPLLNGSTTHANGSLQHHERRRSMSAIRKHLSHVDGSHLSPATPLLDEPKPKDPPALANLKPQTVLQKTLLNIFAMLLVCAAGVFGWWLSITATSHKKHNHDEDDLSGELPEFDVLGQVFGYLCAILYLGSRVPQLLLNYQRKSTEGVSLLFFLFACLGNLTYDLSIFAFNPAPYCINGRKHCLDGEKRMIYARYIAVNASWIVGSLGTLFLDMAIFFQFFLYRKEEDEDEWDSESWDGDRGRVIEAR